MVKPGRPQMTWRMRIACWVSKATNTHSDYIIHIAFPLQQRLYEGVSMSHHTYVACPVRYQARQYRMNVLNEKNCLPRKSTPLGWTPCTEAHFHIL